MDKKTKQGITRRSFLKGTTAGVGIIAATGTELFVKDKAIAQSTSSAPQKKFSFETPPASIPESSIKEKITSDIVIIGAGVSGITASLSAVEAGCKPIIIEKHTTYNTRGGDNAAIDSRLQKKLGIKIDKDEAILELMKYGGNKIDQRLLRLWANNSGKIMDWMMDMTDAAGLETTIRFWPQRKGVDESKEYYKEFTVIHNFTDLQPGLMKVLVENAIKKGVDIRYNTRAVQLVRNGNGRVTGVIAKDKDERYVQYNARKAVILCTGEYGHDEEMMEKYCPWAAEVAKKSNIYDPPVNTGDGHKMAMWIGGIMEPWPHAPVDHTSGGPMGCDPFLHVNTLGERYENEDVPCQSLSNSLKRQPGQTFWQVYDSKYKDEKSKMGIGFLKSSDPRSMAGGGQDGAPQGGAPVAGATVALGGAPSEGGRSGGPPSGNNVQADTIEELAKKMNVPVDTFKATIARYNELAKSGKDLDFGKRADRLTTIEKPPFYAGTAVVGFLVVVGGLYVNPKLQLLDADRKVIPGIYLAGNTVGNRFANDYPTICPGLSHAFAWTTGYLAGKNAVADKA